METAFFYGLLRVWPDLEGIAVRAVSNHLPFDPEDPVPAEGTALRASLEKAAALLNVSAG